MADISALFGILISLGIGFPGLLTTLWLLFPATVDRARFRLEHTPWRCFWLGGVLTALSVVPIVVLLALPFGPAKFVGWGLIALLLAASCLGFAGIAAKMADRLQQNTSGMGSVGAFVRGALALELALAFPIFGWFLLLPFGIVTALGATGFALLHWMPKKVAILPTVTEAR